MLRLRKDQPSLWESVQSVSYCKVGAPSIGSDLEPLFLYHDSTKQKLNCTHFLCSNELKTALFIKEIFNKPHKPSNPLIIKLALVTNL